MQYHQIRPGKGSQVKRKRIFTPPEEQEPSSPHRAGHYAGWHAEDAPHMTTGDVQRHLAPRQPYHTPDEQEAGFHIATINKRYNATPMPDGVMYRQGNDQVYIHNGPPPVPQRASRAKNTTAEQYQVPQNAASLQDQRRSRRRVHWLFFVGLGLLIILLGWVGLNAFSAWWQVHTDDGTYGKPRTYQTDAVVGHQDSASNPSHFLAINLNRHISIIEFLGGRADKAVIYSGPVLLGDGQDLVPATLTFSDINGDGKVDMLLHILDQSITYLNNGTRFVPPSSLANAGG